MQNAATKYIDGKLSLGNLGGGLFVYVFFPRIAVKIEEALILFDMCQQHKNAQINQTIITHEMSVCSRHPLWKTFTRVRSECLLMVTSRLKYFQIA